MLFGWSEENNGIEILCNDGGIQWSYVIGLSINDVNSLKSSGFAFVTTSLTAWRISYWFPSLYIKVYEWGIDI